MKTASWLPLAAILALGTVPAHAQSKKREAPAPVAPVTIAGVRYEAVPFGMARGLDQNGGYVAAIDPASGRELWVAKVYGSAPRPDLEGDKQDIFITAMKSAHDGKALAVETERGGHFELDLATRRARRL